MNAFTNVFLPAVIALAVIGWIYGSVVYPAIQAIKFELITIEQN